MGQIYVSATKSKLYRPVGIDTPPPKHTAVKTGRWQAMYDAIRGHAPVSRCSDINRDGVIDPVHATPKFVLTPIFYALQIFGFHAELLFHRLFLGFLNDLIESPRLFLRRASLQASAYRTTQLIQPQEQILTLRLAISFGPPRCCPV